MYNARNVTGHGLVGIGLVSGNPPVPPDLRKVTDSWFYTVLASRFSLLASRFSLTRGTLAALALLGLAALPNVAHAQTLLVNYSSNASLVFNPGNSGWQDDIFTFTGLTSSITLTSGVAQTVNIVSAVRTLGADFNNATVNKPLSQTITLNGTGNAFGQTATIVDLGNPTVAVNAGGTTNYVFGAGTVGVTLNALATTTFNTNITMRLLFTASSGAAPEPGTLALLALGIAGGVVAKRRK
ncbi:PEP-CTERM sorting domain-containing protein [Armatimonas sp.]|uniref:PEP-CTERM sorting domain-containing protein n=1 Tax=Armatimonas sp. TaxID=1872638 RepID=UPI00374D31A2